MKNVKTIAEFAEFEVKKMKQITGGWIRPTNGGKDHIEYTTNDSGANKKDGFGGGGCPIIFDGIGLDKDEDVISPEL